MWIVRSYNFLLFWDKVDEKMYKESNRNFISFSSFSLFPSFYVCCIHSFFLRTLFYFIVAFLRLHLFFYIFINFYNSLIYLSAYVIIYLLMYIPICMSFFINLSIFLSFVSSLSLEFSLLVYWTTSPLSTSLQKVNIVVKIISDL